MAVVHSDYARLNCRVNVNIKRRAEEAAQLLGQSITDFTEAALAQHAEEVLERINRIRLSNRDFDRFVETVSSAAPPTPALVRAAEEYKQYRADNPDGNW